MLFHLLSLRLKPLTDRKSNGMNSNPTDEIGYSIRFRLLSSRLRPLADQKYPKKLQILQFIRGMPHSLRFFLLPRAKAFFIFETK